MKLQELKDFVEFAANIAQIVEVFVFPIIAACINAIKKKNNR